MYKPVHPGRIIKDDYVEPLELTIDQLADALKVTRQTVSKLINERSGVSPEMAIRLSKVFNTTPELWMNLQQNYDLWQAGENFTDSEQLVSIVGPDAASGSKRTMAG